MLRLCLVVRFVLLLLEGLCVVVFSFLLWLGGGFVSCRLFVGSVFDCHALYA